MSIIQISKIQQRTGNIVDLPQLDEAEFGWASDTKQLFIGKTTPNENIEVLTSYSKINYDQLNGAVGNLNISSSTVENGQVLTYDGTNWVNRGGNAGGIINLGQVSNVKITGGAIGYVLETDGLGNLSWTPKSTVIAFIQNVTKANPAVVTTSQDNFFTEGQKITITNAQGMTQLNGNTYYVNVISSNSFSLYSDSALTTPIDSSGYSNYSYTTATATTASTNRITVGDSAPFSLNQEVKFLGGLANSTLQNNVSYYIKTKPSGTTITVSDELLANGTAGNTKTLATATLSSANVYGVSGRAIASVGAGSGNAAAAGSNTTIQFNNSNLLDGDADFTWNSSSTPKVLGVVGNANVGNLNASGSVTSSRYISNVATGTSPLQVTSTTRVANLNVATAGVAETISNNAQPNITTVGTLTNLTVSGNTFLSTTGGNVGIGTTSPGFLFDIKGANATTTARIVGGNITTPPASGGTLTVHTFTNGVARTGLDISFTDGSGSRNGGFKFSDTQTAGDWMACQMEMVQSFGSSNDIVSKLQNEDASWAGMRFVSQTNSNTVLATSPTFIWRNYTTEQMRITSSGNVGIANNAPTHTLSVTGTMNVSGNANVGNIGAAQVLATANVTAPQLISNVATGTAPILVTSTTQVANLNAATAGSATTAGTVTTNAQPNITSVGTLTGLSVNGNITAANIVANTGIFTGNGSGLTAINASNLSTGTVPSGRLSGTYTITVSGSATTAGTVTTAAQPNITSVGTLSSATVTGNVTAGNVYANAGTIGASLLTGTLTTSSQPNITSVGTLLSVSITGNVTSGNVYANSGTVGAATILTPELTTGANTVPGTITGNWTLTAGSRMQSTYADLAEYYDADDLYAPGTVLMFGGDKEVTIAEDGTNRVAGVVSTNPAYVMNATCPGLLTAIALQGRVPCKVRGKIKKGDMLVSGGHGFARPEQFPTIGTVIGKALQDFEGYEGVIEVAVGRL